MRKTHSRHFINEALGVPDNLYETAVSLYRNILPKLKGFDSSKLKSDKTFKIGFSGKFRIADFNFGRIYITFHFVEDPKENKPDISGMSVQTISRKTDDLKLKYLKYKSIIMTVRVDIPENYDLSEFPKFFESERNKVIESFSHELKHSYDAYKKIYDNKYDRALYDAIQGKRFGIWPIDRFIHDIYYISANESLVRASEVSAAIRNNEISQKEFLKFLSNNDTYLNLKRISEFSYEKLKTQVGEYMHRVNVLLEHLNYDNLENMSDEEKIDEVLSLVRINVANWTVEIFYKMLVSEMWEQLFGFKGEKERIFKRFQKKQTFDTNEEFFEYYEKLFHFVANKMIRKIAKLYAITNKS